MINPPPALPDARGGNAMMGMLPMAGAAVSMSMMMFFRGSGSGFAALGAVIMVVCIAGAGVFYLSQRGQTTRKRRAAREQYMSYLADLREDLTDWEDQVRRDAWRADPPYARLLDVVRDPARLWERRRSHPDFLRVRVGTGSARPREVALRPDDGTTTSPDLFMTAEARALVERFGELPNLPLHVDLDLAGHISVVADTRDGALHAARILLGQAAALHSPDDLSLALITPPAHHRQWSWTRWVPHLLDRRRITGAGPQPRCAPDEVTLARLLAPDLAERATHAAQSYRHGAGRREATARARLLVVDDCYGTTARDLPLPDQAGTLAALGVTMVHLVADRLHEPGEVTARITVHGDELSVEHLGDEAGPVTIRGQLDPAPVAQAEGLARALAPLRLSADSYDDGTGAPPADFASLLGLPDPLRLDVAAARSGRGARDFLRVPLGVGAGGGPVLLDLKESAQLGMGPHGLCVGATGSGKSELLRDLVLSLAVTHSPEQAAMMLVDYKGGATFAPFADLPHVAGLLTNLSGDAALVERMYASLDGEVLRRQQVLADAGKLTDIVEYRLRRDELGQPDELPPLPNLLVIIDEFGELLTAKPEFVELFLRIGRIGRSIGVHLLLTSQRLEEGKLRGLDTYLSYRIGLRTLSESESRTVLGGPDAYHLPPVPGVGYLKVDVTIFEKFKSAYISGPLSDELRDVPSEELTIPVRPMPDYGKEPGTDDEGAGAAEAVATTRTTGPTLMSRLVEQVARSDTDPVDPIWLPPLPEVLTLDQAGDGLLIDADGVHLAAADPAGSGRLRFVLGLLDDPARQWQGPLQVDLGAAGGHLLLLGGPASGKTTALRAIALGLATAHRPTDVALYGIDLLGNGLRALQELPHTAGITGRDDKERLRRILDDLHASLDAREQLFERHGIDGVADLRAARARGQLTELAAADLVLLLDGYGQLGTEFEHLEARVHDLLSRGGRYGIHVVAAARRWSEVRGAQQVAFGNRFELALTEPGESSIDAKLARTLGTVPGRALTSGKLVAQLALPRLDGVPLPDASGTTSASELVRGSWTGPVPPPVRVLPAVLDAADLGADQARTRPGQVALGRFEHDFSPALLDLFGTDPHLLVLGDSDTGKTNLLRLVADRLMGQLDDQHLVFAVFDPRQSLAEAIPEAYLGGYASNATLAAQLADAVAVQLDQRVGLDPVQRAAQPHIVLLIDDYDVLSASGTQPLSALLSHVASGRDLGLHAVVTRRVMGAARGLFEPVTNAVRESGALALLLSGDRSEGLLFPGVRPSVLPVGRAQLIRPGDPTRHVQTALLPQEPT